MYIERDYYMDLDDDSYEAVEVEQEEDMEHFGTPRHSGRYPWGSGENPYQHRDDRSIYRKNKIFLQRCSDLKKEGLSEEEVAKRMGCKNTSDLRAKKSAAKNTNQKIDMDAIAKYRAHGYSTAEIGRRLELAESTVRSLENPRTQANARKSGDVAGRLKEELKTKKYLDVGKGTEAMLGEGGISADKLKKVLNQLENEGYSVQEIKYEQVTNPGQYTTMKVLAPPGTTMEEISRNRADIQTITDNAHADKTVKAFGMERPVSVDSSRIFIRYDDDPVSGSLKDGVIELRRGVPDLSLGNDIYSQVRIGVDDKYYLKGMAVYSDDVPAGYDIIVNSNKKRGTPLGKVFKPMKTTDGKDDGPIDWDNPFGALIKPAEEGGQSYYTDPKTGEKKLRAINKVNGQGDWDEWAKELSSQWLSKQPKKMIERQLNLSFDIKKAQYDEIMRVQNPVVRKYLLEEFGRDCDSSAVHLKAAGFPRQGQKVILPINSLKPGEIYAPSFNDGEYVIGIRHPFQGLWESPILRVNNRVAEGKSVIGNSQDAVGIRSDTANQMSGADFDGDTATFIPIRGMEKDIAYSPADKDLPPSILELRSFDPKKAYKKPDDAEKTGKEAKGKFNKGREMGMVSNLITDMTIMDAPFEDLAKATKHALVVIDAEKHNLDWKQSMIDNDITELRRMYQGKPGGGAATLISRAKSPVYVPDRALDVKINPETGEPIHRESHRSVRGKDGQYHEKQQKITRMESEKDARALMSNPNSGFVQEELYANYANKLKALGNTARKSSLGLAGEYSETAAKTYAKEVASLKAQLNDAVKNAPYERMAQIDAMATYRTKVKGLDPDMSNEDRKKQAKKMRQQSLTASRRRFGASREYIEFTEREWEAMMAGALRPTVVKQILDNSKSETIKTMAMPHEAKAITPSMERIIQSMSNAQYPLSEIAERVGVSTSAVSRIMHPKE